MMQGGEVRPGWPVRVGVGYCEVRRGKGKLGWGAVRWVA